MKKPKARRASLMVTVLVAFLFVVSITLILFVFSTNNMKHAKIQEENMHAYYLAYSGVEIAYAALMEKVKDVPGTDFNQKWKDFIKNRFDPRQSTACISNSGTKLDGYSGVKMDIGDKNRILIKVTQVSSSPTEFRDKEYPNHIRIEAVGETGVDTVSAGKSTKYLYINPENSNQVYWK